MNQIESTTNNLAIGLSSLCVMHCLATPLLIVLLPSAMATQLESEALHTWLLIGVIPTSLFSMLMGCRKHKSYKVAITISVGLLLLISAVFTEDLANGEVLEKVLTVSGACIIALGHYFNFRLCRQPKQCKCD